MGEPMKVLFYCGHDGCGMTGTLKIEEDLWASRKLTLHCPGCDHVLTQEADHFEDLNDTLQRERATLCAKTGPLSDAEVVRIRAIHRALGHRAPEDFSPEQESLVMKIASNVMAKIRNEEKN